MIIKGAPRSDGAQLAVYLLKQGQNDNVMLLEMRNLGGSDLRAGLRLAEIEGEQSKGKKLLYHAQIAPAEGEHMTREQQMLAVEILEKHLGFEDLPRAVVMHEKDGREHLHVAWSRYDRETGRLRRDDFSKMKHVAAAAEIAMRLGFDLQPNPFENYEQQKIDLTREERRQQSRDKDTRAEQQQEPRSFENREERKAWITEVWHGSDSAHAFRAVLEDTGYTLAFGRRGYVVVDTNGEVHSLARQIIGITAVEVRYRMDELDATSIPTVDHVLSQMQRAKAERAPEKTSNPDLSSGIEHGISPEFGKHSAPIVGNPDLFTQNTNSSKGGPTADDVLEALTRHASTFSRQDILKTVDKMTGGGGREPWMMQSGGVEALDPDALRSAEKAFARWSDDNAHLAHKIGFERYVSYVQGRQALRADKDPEAVQARKDSKEAFGKLLAEVMAHAELIDLPDDPDRSQRFTTRDMLHAEMRMRNAAGRLAAKKGHAVPEHLREAVPGIETLGAEQRGAVEHVTAEGDLSLIVGFAGSGKSHMLGVAREAWEATGLRVRGAAPSGIAAESLQEGSGIRSRTLDSLLFQIDGIEKREIALSEVDGQLNDLKRRNGSAKEIAYLAAKKAGMSADLEATRLTKRDVIVIDEAAMVGSKKLGRILSAAEAAGAKVVLVGDHEQLQAVDAGAPFRVLYEQHGGHSITEVRRQNEKWMRDATAEFGRADTAAAMGRYRDAGHIHRADTADQAKIDLIASWCAARQDRPEDTQIILAYTRADVADLNQLARDIYRVEGKLGDDATLPTESGNKVFATGDRMYFTQNDMKLSVRNGNLGTIEKIDGDQIRVALDGGRTVEFDVREYGSITHGYAATIHKSQGATVDRTHVLASKYMDRHAAYVAMTRHRDQVDMHFGADQFRDYDSLIRRISRDGSKDTTLDYLARAAEGHSSKNLREAVAEYWRPEHPDAAAPAWTRDAAPEPIQTQAEKGRDPIEAKASLAANLRELSEAADHQNAPPRAPEKNPESDAFGPMTLREAKRLWAARFHERSEKAAEGATRAYQSVERGNEAPSHPRPTSSPENRPGVESPTQTPAADRNIKTGIGPADKTKRTDQARKTAPRSKESIWDDPSRDAEIQAAAEKLRQLVDRPDSDFTRGRKL